jgi:TolB protein
VSTRLTVLATLAAAGFCASCAPQRSSVALPDASTAPASTGPSANRPASLDPVPGVSAPVVNRSWRPGQKLEPFWISMTAEAERAKWDPQYQPGSAGDPLTLTATPAMPTPPGRGEESSEGLTHVTFAPEGADFDPTVSRDGTLLAFASTQHRPTADIYAKAAGGRTITQLTSDPANDVMPAISPDGSRIAFASNRSGNWDIYIMAASGGQAVQVTSDPAQELHPSWSPDGERLVFCRLGEVSARWEMWVTDVASSGSSEFIGFGLFPEWCPVAGTGAGGRDKILFQRSRERGDRAFSLWTIDYRPGDASSPTEIVSASGSAAINGSWSPDGTRIVYATIDNPNDLSAASDGTDTRLPGSNLWMTAIDGTQRVNLTAGRFMNLMPTWGPGNRIYFVSDRTGVPNVWSIGTEKAIIAATGKAPSKTTDMATGSGRSTKDEGTNPSAESPTATAPTE